MSDRHQRVDYRLDGPAGMAAGYCKRTIITGTREAAAPFTFTGTTMRLAEASTTDRTAFGIIGVLAAIAAANALEKAS